MLRAQNAASTDSLQECNKRMFDNKYAGDVMFRVRNHDNDEAMVIAHKFILISRSPVFRAMLCGPLAENEDEVIDVPDIKVEPFEEFLRFLYCDEVNLDNANVFELLYCSKKYMIRLLEVKCLLYVRENLDVENVCSILEYSLRYDEDDLKEDCIKFIKACTGEVLKSESFFECNVNVLKAIIEQDVMNINAETDVLEALLAWAQKVCELKDMAPTTANFREVLGSVLYSVRLSSLQSNALSSILIGTGLLNKDEEIAVTGHVQGNCSQECPFNHAERLFLGQTHCFHVTEKRLMSCSFLAGNVMSTEIKTSASIRLLSIDILQLEMVIPMTIGYLISVMQDGECLGKIMVDSCRRPKIKDKEVQGRSFINIQFPTPVEINSGKFTIDVCIKACHNFATIATSSPRQGAIKQGGVTLEVATENSSCICAFHYGFGL